MRSVRTVMSFAFAYLKGIVEDYSNVLSRFASSLFDLYHGPVIYGSIVYVICIHAGQATTITSQVVNLVSDPGEVYVRNLVEILNEHGHKIDTLEIGTWASGTLVRTVIQADTMKVCTTFIPAENNFTKRKFGRVSLLPTKEEKRREDKNVSPTNISVNKDDNVSAEDNGYWRIVPISHDSAELDFIKNEEVNDETDKIKVTFDDVKKVHIFDIDNYDVLITEDNE